MGSVPLVDGWRDPRNLATVSRLARRVTDAPPVEIDTPPVEIDTPPVEIDRPRDAGYKTRVAVEIPDCHEA
eukprot:1185640-Prorocentrum_minimum.AAC.2